MKKYSISCILLIVIYTIFAHNIPNDKIQENKIKRDDNETSEECKYINSLLNKNESYNCCKRFTCENGHITKIDLNDSLTTSIPETIGHLIELKELYITGSYFNGIIPKSIGNLKKLKIIQLSFNKLSGTIPDTIGNLSELENLHLASASLYGSIPESIGKLTNLKNLYLSTTYLSGSIPKSIENLTDLETLTIFSNKNLGGPIPESIGNLTKLKQLELNDNNLSGSIPESIGKLMKLKIINLSGNNLSGSIPESIGNLHRLGTLDLSNNNLSGPIPESVGNLNELSHLELFNNNLSGIVPKSIENLTELISISLNDNPLYGKIPNLKRNEKLNSYFFENTNLCYDERENSTSYYVVTPELSYSYPKNNCKECAENASLEDGICQCDSGYVGLGYIYCVEENEIDSIYEECKVADIFLKKDYYFCCDIEKIACEDGHITKLNFPNENIEGIIPESIGILTELREL